MEKISAYFSLPFCDNMFYNVFAWKLCSLCLTMICFLQDRVLLWTCRGAIHPRPTEIDEEGGVGRAPPANCAGSGTPIMSNIVDE